MVGEGLTFADFLFVKEEYVVAETDMSFEVEIFAVEFGFVEMSENDPSPLCKNFSLFDDLQRISFLQQSVGGVE